MADKTKKHISPADGSTGTATAKKAGSVPKPLPLGNARRNQFMLQLFGASTAITILAAGFVWFFLSSRLDEIAAKASQSTPSASPAVASGEGGDAKGEGQQIDALQEQLDAWRRDQLSSQKELREAIERVAAARSGVVETAPAPVGGLLDGQGQAGVARTADMVAAVTPTQAEFIQLKERNRITAYADEAIATGNRKPLETLVEYIRGSGSDHLRDAAQAEYMRVVRMIQFFQREDPGYRLPVGELFKGESVQYEADLKPDHLFKLLADEKQPWEVRVRAAILLKGSDSPETNTKLIEAIKGDPSLEVAKHAQISLEQRIQRRFRLFDIPAIEAWEKEQRPGELPQMRP
jgi:hypothetical protein